jgi:hygromycin-B 7''-O-kinase
MERTPLLPAIETLERLEALPRDDARLLRGAAGICARHGLAAAGLRRFEDGSLPVYAVGDARVLKLYPPFDLPAHRAESLALRVLDGRLPVPTPRVEATGETEGWGYLLMERLPGVSLAAAWPEIPDADRVRLAAALGEGLAALHAVRDPRLEPLRGDWPGFLATQRRGCVERQRSRGLGEPWLEQIPGFLESAPLGDAPADSLLHTEIMREHLLVDRGANGWTLTGLFDFEPAMLGAPEYEFAAVGLFVSGGDPTLLREALLAYGYAARELGDALSRRLLAYTLLHRYANLPWYLKRLPPPEGARTLDDLATAWWGLAKA